MDTTTIIAVVGTGIGAIGFIYTIVRNIKQDIKSFRNDFDSRFDKMDQRWVEINNRVDAANARSDGIMNSLQQIILDFKNENKDFHGRLSSLETRNKK